MTTAPTGADRRRKRKEEQADRELFLLGVEDVNQNAEDDIDLGAISKNEDGQPALQVDAGDTGARSSDCGTASADTGSEDQAYGTPAAPVACGTPEPKPTPQPKSVITKRLRREVKGVVIE